MIDMKQYRKQTSWLDSVTGTRSGDYPNEECRVWRPANWIYVGASIEGDGVRIHINALKGHGAKDFFAESFDDAGLIRDVTKHLAAMGVGAAANQLLEQAKREAVDRGEALERFRSATRIFFDKPRQAAVDLQRAVDDALRAETEDPGIMTKRERELLHDIKELALEAEELAAKFSRETGVSALLAFGGE